jgi:hypothetical protein
MQIKRLKREQNSSETMHAMLNAAGFAASNTPIRTSSAIVITVVIAPLQPLSSAEDVAIPPSGLIKTEMSSHVLDASK